MIFGRYRLDPIETALRERVRGFIETGTNLKGCWRARVTDGGAKEAKVDAEARAGRQGRLKNCAGRRLTLISRDRAEAQWTTGCER
jgi:hypothetical protein